MWSLDHTTWWPDSSSGLRLPQNLSPGLLSRCTVTGLRKHLGIKQVSSFLTWLHWELQGNLTSEHPGPLPLQDPVPRGSLARILVYKPQSPSQVLPLPLRHYVVAPSWASVSLCRVQDCTESVQQLLEFWQCRGHSG